MNIVSRVPAIAAGLLALSAAPALANPFPPTVWQCLRNDQITVLANEKTEDVGTRFLVRTSTGDLKADCLVEQRPTDVVIGGGDDSAYYYIALAKTFLILDAGTGPDRGLAIFNLPSAKPVFEGGYSVQGNCSPTAGCESDEFTIGENGVTFWREVKDKATAKNCKDYAKFMKTTGSAAIEEKSLFRFSTQKIESLKDRRCVQQQ